MNSWKRYCAAVLAAVGVTACAGIADGLILYAPMDGSTEAAAANGRPVRAEKLKFIDGRFGKAVRLEGGAKLAYPAKDQFDFERGTVAMWIRRDRPWSEQRSWRIFKAAAGKEWNENAFYIGGTRWDELCVSQHDRDKKRNLVLSPNKIPYPAGEWQHLAVTWSGPEIRVYMNGKEISYKTPSNPMRERPEGTPHRLEIGSESSDKEVLAGEIDELRIYNRALPPEEVKALFNHVPQTGEAK